MEENNLTKLDEFVAKNDVLKTDNLVNLDFLKRTEELIGLNIGEQLKTYILKYGFLIYESMEFYGINSKQEMDSDLIQQTLYLHSYFPLSKKYFVFGNRGDGLYILVDSSDRVFEFDSSIDKIIETNEFLFEYILNRFKEEKLFN